MLTLFQHETVRFHLGFEPKAVSLTTALRDFNRPRREVLEPTRDPSWEVKPAEVLVLSATSRAGHASYAACLRIRAKL